MTDASQSPRHPIEEDSIQGEYFVDKEPRESLSDADDEIEEDGTDSLEALDHGYCY